MSSLTLGPGQFCTSPGLVLAVAGPYLDRFKTTVAAALLELPAPTMLTPGTVIVYEAGVDAITRTPTSRFLRVARLGITTPASGAIRNHRRRVSDESESAGRNLRSNLAHRTVPRPCYSDGSRPSRRAVDRGRHIIEPDYLAAKALLRHLERKVERIPVSGCGTGVEVAHAMVLAGPFPSTSEGRLTGRQRRNRPVSAPVSYQIFPMRCETPIPSPSTSSSIARSFRLKEQPSCNSYSLPRIIPESCLNV